MMNKMMGAPAPAGPAMDAGPGGGGEKAMQALGMVQSMAEQDPQFRAGLIQLVDQMRASEEPRGAMPMGM